MLIAVIPFVVALLGLLMWVLSSHPKVQRAGEILFTVGVFWLVYSFSGKTLKIG
jgi:hypothetical protein